MQEQDFMIPLVIGVTGYRDIRKEDIKPLKEKIEEIFTALKKKYPTTPFILLSPLADGADRIVANVALEKFKEKITVKVPIPFPKEIYTDTFGKGIYKELEKENQLIIDSKEEYDKLTDLIEKEDKSFLIELDFNKELYNKLDNASITESFYESFIRGNNAFPYNYNDFLNNFNDENRKREDKDLKRYLENEYLQKLLKCEGYVRLGEYVAIHSHILIALENPDAIGKVGGTSEVVNKKLTGEYKILGEQNDVSQPEQGIVYHINTPRLSKDIKKDKYKIFKRFPNSKKLKVWENIKIDRCSFRDYKEHLWSEPCLTITQKEKLNSYSQQHMQIECLNKSISKNINNRKLLGKIDDSIEKNGKDDNKTKALIYKSILRKSEEEISEVNKMGIENKNIERLVKIRRAVAIISSENQSKMQFIENFLLALIILTTTIVMTKSIYPEVINTFLNIGYPLIIALFYILIIYFKNFKCLYEDTRAISEGLRVQIAWNISKINESVALNYLSRQKDELNWIRSSLRTLNIFSSHKQGDLNKEDIKKVDKYWIDEQTKYFSSKIDKLKIIDRNVNRKIKILFTLFIVFSLIFSFNEYFQYFDIFVFFSLDSYFNTIDLEVIKTLALAIPLILLAFYKSKQLFDGHSKTIKQYALSLDSFKRAKSLLSKKEEDEEKLKIDKKEVLKKLGQEALFENSFWTILRREKNYKTPSL